MAMVARATLYPGIGSACESACSCASSVSPRSHRDARSGRGDDSADRTLPHEEGRDPADRGPARDLTRSQRQKASWARSSARRYADPPDGKVKRATSSGASPFRLPAKAGLSGEVAVGCGPEDD